MYSDFFLSLNRKIVLPVHVSSVRIPPHYTLVPPSTLDVQPPKQTPQTNPQNNPHSYNASDPTLSSARFAARAFAHKYNTWFPPADSTPDGATGFQVLATERLKMLKGILGYVGDDEVCKSLFLYFFS